MLKITLTSSLRRPTIAQAYLTVIELLTPLFRQGLEEPPALLVNRTYAANALAVALAESGRSEAALRLFALKIRLDLEARGTAGLRVGLSNYSSEVEVKNCLSAGERGFRLALRLAETLGATDLTKAHVHLMSSAIRAGRWNEAERSAEAFRKGEALPRRFLRPGTFESLLCRMDLARRRLEEVELKKALRIATEANSRQVTRELHELRGEWELERGRLRKAAEAFGEAIVMAQKAGVPVGNQRARLALPRARMGETHAAAELLAECGDHTKDWRLPEAWLALGDREKAREHGLRGYEWAWADGPPHVNWWELQRMKKLLAELGVEPPDLPPFDPGAVEPLPHEEKIVAFIEELEAEQKEQERKKKGS